jgi:hypothetical protein
LTCHSFVSEIAPCVEVTSLLTPVRAASWSNSGQLSGVYAGLDDEEATGVGEAVDVGIELGVDAGVAVAGGDVVRAGGVVAPAAGVAVPPGAGPADTCAPPLHPAITTAPDKPKA